MFTPAAAVGLFDRERIPTKYPLVGPAFGHWLTGFVDGEGCFRIHKEKGGDYYACHFQVKLRNDDAALLLECRERTGLGTVYVEIPTPTHPQAVWVVQDRAGCWGVAAIFDRYPLRSKKARDYRIWKEALQHWSLMRRGNRWHGPRDWTEMERLKLLMEDTRRYPEAGGGECN